MSGTRAGAGDWAADLPLGVRSSVTDALAHFEALLVGDGGALEVQAFAAGGEMVVEYRKGTNDDCPSCVITHDDLAVFIREALEARSVPVTGVRVVDPAG
ncbi:MAG: hypothetical protein AB7L84_05580 [Acidimicrobiia bacterium]